MSLQERERERTESVLVLRERRATSK